MKAKKIPPVHPGEILLEEFLKPMEISQNKLGRELGVSPRRVNEIVHGKRSVTADTALRLSIFFGNSASFWLGLQMDYDLDVAQDTSLDKIKKEVQNIAAA
ncbi:MAG: HigA family addiction module antidote protein [Deltaproteobacteria bacterium]|nr:HigA family addiction module antidote protein [Deltaproteobacteria bacterium]